MLNYHRMLLQSMVFKALVAALSVTTTFAAVVPEKRSTSKVILVDFRVEKSPPLPLSSDIVSEGAEQTKREVIPLTLARDDILYLLQLDIGSNQETFTFQIDTGSSNLFVPLAGATCECAEEARYDPQGSTSSHLLYNNVTLLYGEGHAYGDFYTDTVSLTQNPQVSLKDFQFVGANNTDIGYGYLGLGFDNGEYYPEYPNFPQSLKNQGYLDKNAYSLYLDSAESPLGTIIFGGKDTSKYEGELKTLPITHDFRLAVALESISSGNFTVSGNQINSMFDTGSTFTWLQPQIYQPLAEKYGWTKQPGGGYHGPCEGDDLVFDFGYDLKISVPYNQLITRYDGKQCWVYIIEHPTDEIINILGDNFLRSVYAVFDLDERTISAAPVVYTSDSNVVPL